MTRNTVPLVAIALLVGAGSAAAQATGTPSYNAPYRAFTRSEVGATLSFPDGGGTAIEGQYRFGYHTFDIGLRGGIDFPGNGAKDVGLVGAEARDRVITHTQQFPLDGAVVVGAGFQFDGGTAFIAPIGLSLGRRLLVQGSEVSIVPYVQPTGFLTNTPDGLGGRTTDFNLALGAGADFRLSAVFDARVSVGIGGSGTPGRGLAISAVWVH